MDVRPHNPAKGPKDVDESSDAYDTIDWLVKHVPGNNGRVGDLGHLVPRLLRGDGRDRRAPGARGGLAAGARSPTGSSATTSTTTARSSCRTPSTSSVVFGKPRREPTTKWGPPFDHGTADGYRFFLEAGPMPNFDRKYLKGEVAFWKEVMAHESYDAFWQARNIRPHLKEIRPAVLTVGRLVRRRGPLRRARDLQGDRAAEPGIANRLVMGPWSHGGWARGDGEALGSRDASARPTSKFFQEQIELPFFRALPEGQATTRSCPRPTSSRPAATSGARSTPGRRRDAKPLDSTSRRGAGSAEEPPAEHGRGLRRVRERPASRCRSSRRSTSA